MLRVLGQRPWQFFVVGSVTYSLIPTTKIQQFCEVVHIGVKFFEDFFVMVNNGVKIAAVIAHFCGSQKQFADRLGVAAAVVSNWKQRGIDSVTTLGKIFEAFPNLNPAFFFDDNAPIEKQPAVSASFSNNGSQATVNNNDSAVVNRFLSIIEEKDRQIAQLIAKL